MWTRCKRVRLLVGICCCVVAACASSWAEEAKPSVAELHYTVHGRFTDVLENLEFFIAERGITISNRSHIAAMLQRTREAVGATKQIYLNAEVLGFCSAQLSRNMLEADPHGIVFCPYNIAIYELADQPGVIHLAYQPPPIVGSEPSQAAVRAIIDLVDGILRGAAEQ